MEPTPKPTALVITEAELIELLRLNEKPRSERARRMACWRFRTANGIKTLPGGNYSMRAVENALNK